MKLKFAWTTFFTAMLFAALLLVSMTRAAVTPRRIEVTAKRFAFEPGEITLRKGEPVILVLKSVDVAHGIRIKELGVDAKVGKGQTTEFPFTPEKTGTFTGRCSVFCGSGHGTMALTLHVVD
jgi:cytochrome c oxidase subunit 2